MANDNNVLTPEDPRFELPDVDGLLENSKTVEQTEGATQESSNLVKDIDPYSTVPEEPKSEETPEEPIKELDALHQYLTDRGITDTKKLQYEDESGNLTEVDFDTLSKEEQLNIINELSKPNITDEEYQTIDYLRKNNMTLAQVIDYFAEQRLQKYINDNGAPEKTYTIDDYTDDELYLADMKSRHKNDSDEKLMARLEAAKSDEETFKNDVEELREFYKAKETEELEKQHQNELDAQEQYKNALYSAINSFNEIALDYSDEQSDTLEIETEDKNKALSYLLDKDAEGKTQLLKDIENPDALVDLAWLRTSGADALAGQSRYYKEIISERNKEISRLNKQIEKLKTSNSVVVPSIEPKQTSKNSSSPWDVSGLI